MSKFQIAKGLLENLPNDYTEGKVYFIYDNVNPENLNIYADIDGIRRKIDAININDYIKIGGKAGGIPYGNVDSTSTSTVFTATVDGLAELYDGACMMLHNGVVTSAKNFTINVNGLGAKKCYSSLTNATQETTIFNANYTLMFVYSTALNGGNGGWWVYRGIDTNTTYTPVKLGFGYGHCTTAAATAAKAVAISGYVLNTGGIVSVLFDHDVQAGATLNVTSKGAKAIYYNGAAIANGIIKAGDTATFMYSGQYHLLSIDRWGSDIDGKQPTLVSGTNIKTVNGTSLLGSGDITTPTYTLPEATTSTLGGVKVDGTTITATDGVISAVGGGGGVSYATQAIRIPASAWRGTTATVSASAATATNDVIVAPAPESVSTWASAGIYCSAQGSGTLTFACTTAPTVAVTANVMAFEGGETIAPSTYSVTVSLTNPSYGHYFKRCDIYGYDTTAGETTVLLGEIDSPTGSATVEYDPSLHEKLSLHFDTNWGTSYTASNITCTGGVSFYNFNSMNDAIFNVEGDGTITIDGIDYDD